MIPIAAADEPPTFDAKVRLPGKAWLASKGLEKVAVAPKGTKIKAIWTACLPELMSAYDNVCAYASLKIHPVTGGPSVEHFAPKSRALPDAYEWINYRLVCAKLNARKNNFTDVLDPFTLAAGTFRLSLVNGSLYPSPALTGAALVDAMATVTRLKLDDAEMRNARLNLIDLYLKGLPSWFLKEESPFVWAEMDRQGLLRPHEPSVRP